MMEEKVVAVKAAFALIGGVLSQALGGYDHYLKVLLLVMAVDILTGIIKAVHGKRVSSSKMRGGLLNKVVILFLVALSVELDHAFLAAIGEPIMIGEFTIQIRNCPDRGRGRADGIPLHGADPVLRLLHELRP